MTKRAVHSATLLKSGRVLVAGGSLLGTTQNATAEIFDPITNEFYPVPGKMTSPRAYHGATLLNDGTVLLAGGLYYDPTGITVSSADLFVEQR